MGGDRAYKPHRRAQRPARCHVRGGRRLRLAEAARADPDRRYIGVRYAGLAWSAFEYSKARAGTDGRFSQRNRSEEHTSELQSLMRNSYVDFCLKTEKLNTIHNKKVDLI